MPNIRSDILEKVIAYAKYHTENASAGDDVKAKFDQDFVKVEQGTLFEMILAANYLDIKPMLDLTCKTVADMIKGKSPEEIRKMFNIPNDFTPEEEEQVRKENEWYVAQSDSPTLVSDPFPLGARTAKVCSWQSSWTFSSFLACGNISRKP